MTKGLVHLDGTGSAVETNQVNTQWIERGDRGSNLGARQHASREFNRHLGLDGHNSPMAGHGTVTSGDGGFARQQVKHRLDQQEVDTALEEPVGQLFVAGRELVVGDLAEGRELGARSH